MIKDDKCYKRYPVYTLISTNPGFPQKKTIKKTDFWGSWSCMGTWPAPPATAETPRLGSRVHGTPGPHPRWPPVEGGLTMAMVDYGWDVDSLIPGIPQKITLKKARKNDTSSCSHLTILSQCKSPCVFVDKLLCGWMKVELIGWKKRHMTIINHQSSNLKVCVKLEGLYQTWRFVSMICPSFHSSKNSLTCPSLAKIRLWPPVAFTKCTQRKRGASSSNLPRLWLKLSTFQQPEKIHSNKGEFTRD